ncbi:hypothetical protein BDW22DRAFT_1392606 [Trametopsis cervina]|nr:hypothetical protein BDW22DRAFT_1392606 [Trametopsis cervina]
MEADYEPVPSQSITISSSSSSLKRKRELFDESQESDSPSKVAKTVEPANPFSSGSGESLPIDSFPKAHPEKPYVIAHDIRFIRLLGEMPVGFWWEVARELSHGTPKGRIPMTLKEETTNLSNAYLAPGVSQGVKLAGPHDPNLDRAFTQEKAAKAPWEELDREEEHEKRTRASRPPHTLYMQDTDKGWYGGKVHFTGKLVKNEDKNPEKERYRIKLDTPYLGSSNRFARRFGSKRLFRVRLSSEVLFQDVMQFFMRPVIVFTRVFRAFFAKEGTIFYIETNETVTADGETSELKVKQPLYSAWSPSGHNIPFLDFLQWHNPLELNSDQAMAKYASRFALGLSNSVPGVRLTKDQLEYIDDIVAEEYLGKAKVPAEYTMTDGCGLANANLFRLLQETFNWDTYPTAVQVRINGGKGLLTLHPTHAFPTADRQPRVWLRKSQRKIVYPLTDDDVAHYTVEVLRSSHMTTPSKLSTETIINLAENGVGHYRLWANIEKAHSVVKARLARHNAGSARAQGFIFEDTEEVDDEDVITDETVAAGATASAAAERSTAWWEDPVSGQPSSLEETCMGLLDAGFSPSTCSLLRAKLMEVAKNSLKPLAKKYHIKIDMSCTAFVVPDPLGVLEPGECQVLCSSNRLTNADGTRTHMILGDLLLTRHPCKVPSDVQRAKGVLRLELRHYVDVIVVSTKGHLVNGETLSRHLASMTGGGDFDGDTMSAYWQPELVASFNSADKMFADEPKAVSDYIVKTQESGREFLERVPPHAPLLYRITELQKYLLAPLKEGSMAGLYSTWWENSIYMNGYDHPETIRLAYIFCAVLDGAKTGVTVKPEKKRSDTARYSKTAAAWKNAVPELAPSRTDDTNVPSPKRGPGLPVFIMDHLRAAVKQEYSEQRAVIEARLQITEFQVDADLTTPWHEFEKRVSEKESTLGGPSQVNMKAAIETHVLSVFEEWSNLLKVKKNEDKAVKFTAMDIRTRQDGLRAISQMFATGPAFVESYFDSTEANRLKASYAYIVGCARKKHRFPFDVAYRVLCGIKAHAVSNGTEKPVASDFYARFILHKACLGD